MAVTMDSPAAADVAAQIGAIEGFSSVWFAPRVLGGAARRVSPDPGPATPRTRG
jgi:hypothetical protein